MPGHFWELEFCSQSDRQLLRFGSTFCIDGSTEQRLLNGNVTDLGDPDKTKPHLHIRLLKIISRGGEKICQEGARKKVAFGIKCLKLTDENAQLNWSHPICNRC